MKRTERLLVQLVIWQKKLHNIHYYPPSLLSPLNKKKVVMDKYYWKGGGVIFAQETIDSTRDL